jgi:hypothetical protein
MQIPLTAADGTVRAHALVDSDDFAWLNQWTWRLSHSGYVRRGGGRRGVHISMHRQIMGQPSQTVDHIDRNPLNNRRSNLRLATYAEQSQNRVHPNASSGVRGVTWHRRAGKWQVQHELAGSAHYLGLFSDLEEALVVAEAWRAEHMPFYVGSRP